MNQSHKGVFFDWLRLWYQEIQNGQIDVVLILDLNILGFRLVEAIELTCLRRFIQVKCGNPCTSRSTEMTQSLSLEGFCLHGEGTVLQFGSVGNTSYLWIPMPTRFFQWRLCRRNDRQSIVVEGDPWNANWPICQSGVKWPSQLLALIRIEVNGAKAPKDHHLRRGSEAFVLKRKHLPKC